jgi:hypothetical protein
MAGFLAHLASRLDGPEGLLRPRVPSLFEPVPTVASVAGGFQAEADEHPLARPFERVDEIDSPVVAEPSSAHVPHAQAHVPHAYGPGTSALVVAPKPADTDRRPDPKPQAARDDPASVNRDPRRQTVAHPQSRTFSDLPTEAAPEAPAPKGARTTIRPATVVSKGPTAARRRVQQIDAVEQTNPPRLDARHRLAQIPSALPDAGREIAPERIRGPAAEAGGILQAPVVARIVSEPRLPASRALKSEPAIHVTIGRVEVRAVSSPASDSRRGERAPSPVMSLDEYLRMRAR